MRIRTFTPLRPRPELAPVIASLPYDVVTTEEARALAEGNPLSMLHIVRAEIDFPPGQDAHADAVYARAVENFRRLQAEGHLEREGAPCLYVYQQQMGAHTQRGLVALCLVEDYDNGLIKKHERTRRDKEDDRTRLTSDMSANAGPVFMTYRDVPEVTALMDAAAAAAPLFDFTAHDGIRHTGWRIEGGENVVRAFAQVPCVYIADGHHRAASAARVGRERREANPAHTGAEDYNAFLTVLFPASQLKILPYNRTVTTLRGRSPEAFLTELAKVGTLTPHAAPAPSAPGNVSVYLAGRWHGLRFSEPFGSDPVSRLDVSMLQDRVLAPLLGIDDPRTSQDVSFVGGIRGTDYLVAQVDSGAAAVAFSMYPTTLDQLMDIADAGQIMPPKSTWFEPKLRSGLFIHTFEGKR